MSIGTSPEEMARRQRIRRRFDYEINFCWAAVVALDIILIKMVKLSIRTHLPLVYDWKIWQKYHRP